MFLESLTEIDRRLAAADDDHLEFPQSLQESVLKSFGPTPTAPFPSPSPPPPAAAPRPLPPEAVSPEREGLRPLLDLSLRAHVERDRPPDPIMAIATGPRPPGVSAPRPIAPTPAATALTYKAFYGLNEEPFSLSTDPSFLYRSHAHDRVAQELLTAIRRRDGLVVMTWPPGSGKTTLGRTIIDQLDHRTLTSLLAAPITSAEDLLQTVLVDFGVMSREDVATAPQQTLEELGSALRTFLDSLASLDASAVVVVDEAHSLPVEVLDALRVLSDVGGGEPWLLQIVLIGQPALMSMLRRRPLRALNKAVAVRCEVGPLAEDEIGAYVMHRLAVAGNSARVEFDAAATARIYELSGGLPGSVNILCDRALALGFQASADVIDASMIERAAADRGISAPVPEASRTLKMIAAAIAFVFLMLVGAGGAAWTFRHDLARIVAHWQGVPPPPSEPARPAPGFAPLKPPPVPEPKR